MQKRRIYSTEFKEKVIALVEKDGLSCVQVEKDIGIGKGILSRWIKKKRILKMMHFVGSAMSDHQKKNLRF